MYPLVQTLRGHEHDLGTTGDLRCSQRHRIDQNLPYPQRYKFHSRERKREFTEKEREREREVEPLKMSFWPRVRTLVRGWRRDLRWVMVESGERVSGIDLPLNLIEIVMSLLSPLPFPFGPAAPPSSIAVLCLVAGSLMSGYRLSASVCVSGAGLVCVFKNWKLLFKNICGNTCGWKSTLKYVKCCLKTENCCLKL